MRGIGFAAAVIGKPGRRAEEVGGRTARLHSDLGCALAQQWMKPRSPELGSASASLVNSLTTQSQVPNFDPNLDMYEQDADVPGQRWRTALYFRASFGIAGRYKTTKLAGISAEFRGKRWNI